MGEFLSRPTLIDTVTWTEGTVLNQSVLPWYDFFNSPAIKKKLDNFYLLRCNIKIKILINASPFYYGLGLVSYEPLAHYYGGYLPTVVQDSGSDRSLVPLSQRPHVWIYPQNSTGAEMTLPYINNKNWLNVTSALDFQDMGILRFRSVDVLNNANSVAGSNVTIQVFAWAENVVTSGPTDGLALQSGELLAAALPFVNEYGQTIISAASGLMSSGTSAVPPRLGTINSSWDTEPAAAGTTTASNSTKIGNYMTMSTVNKSSNSSDYKMYGGSKTRLPPVPTAFKELPFPCLSSTTSEGPRDALTLDPGNELTVDPRVIGADADDEMSIANIVSRESYLTKAVWTLAAAPEHILFSTPITPQLMRLGNFDSKNYSLMQTPMCHVSRMFKHWRGDIIFRFQIICSQFHRGRLRISWDPQGQSTTVGPTTTVYTKVYDISQVSDIEISIPFLQPISFLECGDVYSESFSVSTSTLAATIQTANTDYENGVLTVSVLNELTAPSADAPVIVAISTRASANFAFAEPEEIGNVATFFKYPLDFPDDLRARAEFKSKAVRQVSANDSLHMQSGVVATNVEVPTNAEHNVESMGQVSAGDDALYTVYMGERITSIRNILRRSALSRVIAGSRGNTDVVQELISIMNRYPLTRGFDPDGINDFSATYTAPYNWVNSIPLTHMANCYLGRRGSINWDFNCATPDAVGQIAVTRYNSDYLTSGDYRTTFGFDTTVAVADVPSTYLNNSKQRSGWAGRSLVNTRTQTGLSVNAPNYSRFRMQSTNPYFTVLGTSNDNSRKDAIMYSATLFPTSVAKARDNLVQMYCSTGNDFALLFFMNVPVMYVLK